MARGSAAIARLHRQWLRRLPELTGKSLTALATEIKISPSTLTRPVSEGDHGTSTLRATTIEQIVAYTGVPPPSELTVPRPRGATGAPRAFEQDAAPYVAEPDDPVAAAVAALIGGRNAIAPFRLRSAALDLAGFLPGDIVLVDLNAHPEPGQAVCAQVYDWTRMRAETVMRLYVPAPPVRLLVPRSTDPALVPIVIDDDRVMVKGVLLPHRLR